MERLNRLDEFTNSIIEAATMMRDRSSDGDVKSVCTDTITILDNGRRINGEMMRAVIIAVGIINLLKPTFLFDIFQILRPVAECVMTDAIKVCEGARPVDLSSIDPIGNA